MYRNTHKKKNAKKERDYIQGLQMVFYVPVTLISVVNGDTKCAINFKI